MNRSASIDPDLFAVTPLLRAAYAVFARELGALPPAAFRPYYDGASYRGRWEIMPFLFDVEPLPPEYDLDRNRALCPESWRLVAAWPRLTLAGFSRMHPGCAVPEHHDAPKPNVLRFHLGLDGIEQGTLIFAEGEFRLHPGQVRVIDHSMMHGAMNGGSTVRNLFVMDHELDAAEVAAVVRHRGAVHLGPLGHVADVGPALGPPPAPQRA